MYVSAHDINRQTIFNTWAHGVVVSHPLRMRKALGSNPSVSILIIIWKSGILLAVVAAIKMTTVHGSSFIISHDS